jgi:hypothetical protein
LLPWSAQLLASITLLTVLTVARWLCLRWIDVMIRLPARRSRPKLISIPSALSV